MPNRIIRESICTSESIDNLTWFEEVFFYRLIVVCDDYGIFDARPKILNARIFPLKNTTDKQISDALQSLRTAGIVDLYEVDGKPFLQLRTWDKYQTVRAKKSKFPQKNESESICKQLQADDCKCSRNPIQSESISEYEKNTTASPSYSYAPSDDEVIRLPLNSGSYSVLREDVEKWQTLYPAVDVLSELRKMAGWLDGNPKRRKTKAGIVRFINGWLAKEQDKPHKTAGEEEGNVFLQLLKEKYDGQ